MKKKREALEPQPDEEVDPETVIQSRSGAVLGRQTILKSDHFPGCQNMKLTPLIEGAPNFRKVDGLPVYGVAIPSISGLRSVLDKLDARNKPLLWHNMREEPVLYVNGEPYVLRDVECPFTNLEYPGIDKERVEDMEDRLKADVVAEATNFNQRVLVSGETDDFKVIDIWLTLEGPAAIQTPKEVYNSLIADRYKVDYLRVPMTDEKAPKETVVDLLTKRIAHMPPEAGLMFNCQMGRGRTTTGMVIACLVCLKHCPPAQPLPSLPERERAPGTARGENALLNGWFPCVRSLIRLLDGGTEGKALLDDALNRCSAMQNLREAILTFRRYLVAAKDEVKKAEAYRRGLEYLERYYVLISYAVYLSETDIAAAEHESFKSWWGRHAELQSILQRMLWRNPVSALTSPLDVASGMTDSISVVDARNGAVLSKLTILKEEPYPGLQKEDLPTRIEGAPNFRQVEGKPVYGCAIPTFDGIRNTLRHTSATWPGLPLKWINLREEPVVYVRGKPYVLREAARPYHNLQEYSGITAERVSAMEARLKVDVLCEAACYERRLLVCRESDDGQVTSEWEEEVKAAAVMTPEEMFSDPAVLDGLPEGTRAPTYLRIPITHQRTPKKTDFDRLAEVFAELKEPTVLAFSCQGGAGRTTTAMVVACLCLHSDAHTNRPPEAPTLSHAEACVLCDRRGAVAAGGGGNGGKTPLSKTQQRQWEDNLLDHLKVGEFSCVRKLVGLLVGGNAAKARLDRVVDDCGAVENIREVILERRQMMVRDMDMEHADRTNVADKNHAMRMAVETLERYLTLIMFTAWLGSDARQLTTSFTQWLGSHPEIRQVKKNIWARPLQTLEYHAPKSAKYDRAESEERLVVRRQLIADVPTPIAVENPGAAGAVSPQVEAEEALPTFVEAGRIDAEQEMTRVAGRRGNLLNASTVLYRHRIQAGSAQELMTHVMHGLPLYSMGSREMSYVRESVERLVESHQRVLVSDLREEPVLYIDGEPYTLSNVHDLQGPHVVQSTGIAGHMLEHLEDQLRKDVLAEARRTDGCILLRWQVPNAKSGKAHTRTFVPFLLNLTKDPALVVRTPRQIFDALQESGVPLLYRRNPLTSARHLEAHDLDSIRLACDGALKPDAEAPAGPAPVTSSFLWISHNGFGSVGFAMAATACVLASRGMVSEEHAPFLRFTDNSPPPVSRRSAQSKKRLKSGNDPQLDAKHALWRQGEFRDVMGLVRVLDNGLHSKRMADWALEGCGDVGSLLDDLYQLRIQMTEDTRSAEVAPKALGYLRRYFSLVAFCGYLRSGDFEKAQFGTSDKGSISSSRLSLGRSIVSYTVCFICQEPNHIACECPFSFARWMAQRHELEHMLSNLSLE